MYQPRYASVVTKTIPPEYMPGYQPTSSDWYPTSLKYQVFRIHANSKPTFASNTPFDPQLQKIWHQYKWGWFNPMNVRSGFLPIPSDALMFFIEFANAKKAKEERLSGIKRKLDDNEGSSLIQEEAPKRQCLAIRSKKPEVIVEVPGYQLEMETDARNEGDQQDAQIDSETSESSDYFGKPDPSTIVFGATEKQEESSTNAFTFSLSIRTKPGAIALSAPESAPESQLNLPSTAPEADLETMMANMSFLPKKGWHYIQEDEEPMPAPKLNLKPLPVKRELRELRSNLETRGLMESKYGTGLVDIFAETEVPEGSRRCKIKKVSYKV